MSGILDEVAMTCHQAFADRHGTGVSRMRAALEKYRELTGVGPITAEMVAGGLAVAGWSGDALTRAERKDVAAKLNALSNRQPAPAVVVPDDVVAWADKKLADIHSGDWSRTVATWIKSLIPAPPKPEPGQRAYEIYADAAGKSEYKWATLLPDVKRGFVAVEAALRRGDSA